MHIHLSIAVLGCLLSEQNLGNKVSWRSAIGVLMNLQWLRRQHLIEQLLSISSFGKEPLEIMQKHGRSPFHKKAVFSFQVEWPGHIGSSFTDQVVLPLYLDGNHFDSASRDICLVISNFIVELSWYFQFSRLNSLSLHTLLIKVILCYQNHWAFNTFCKCSAVQSFT